MLLVSDAGTATSMATSMDLSQSHQVQLALEISEAKTTTVYSVEFQCQNTAADTHTIDVYEAHILGI